MPGWYGGYPEYVSVAQRKAKAMKEMAKLSKKGIKITPVVIDGKKIATTFWGLAWCDHIESFHDYENRLPRGRTYVRNGSVVDLQMEKGKITARVQGSELYQIEIKIKKLAKTKWEKIKNSCAGKVGSLIELIRGELSSEIITALCHEKEGLFPLINEIEFKCSCPDSASLCKHLAATLYGVGARLDHEPELFFLLRDVDKTELFSVDISKEINAKTKSKSTKKDLGAADISKIFDIELDDLEAVALVKKIKKEGATKKVAKKVAVLAKPAIKKNKKK